MYTQPPLFDILEHNSMTISEARSRRSSREQRDQPNIKWVHVMLATLRELYNAKWNAIRLCSYTINIEVHLTPM